MDQKPNKNSQTDENLTTGITYPFFRKIRPSLLAGTGDAVCDTFGAVAQFWEMDAGCVWVLECFGHFESSAAEICVFLKNNPTVYIWMWVKMEDLGDHRCECLV